MRSCCRPELHPGPAAIHAHCAHATGAGKRSTQQEGPRSTIQGEGAGNAEQRTAALTEGSSTRHICIPADAAETAVAAA